MAVNYKALNRQQDLAVHQKAALKKVFELAEVAVRNGDSSLVSRTLVHLALAGNFEGDIQHDIQALMKEVRSAIDDSDANRDIGPVISSFRMDGNSRKIVRTMADAVIAQVV